MPPPADGWVHPEAAHDLLGSYDINLVGRFARSAAEACAIADDIGLPVAVKAAEPDVVHRTDRGMVRIGLGSADEVASAVAWFESQHGSPCTVLVQPMATGIELVLGVVRDKAFGPLVMIGAGGVATDVWDDRAFLVPPFHESDAMRVLRSLRLWPLLAGFRGAPPAASADVAQLAARLGRLAVDVPEVAEIDINPVLVGPQQLRDRRRQGAARPRGGDVDRPAQPASSPWLRRDRDRSLVELGPSALHLRRRRRHDRRVTTYVYNFADLDTPDRDLLGGKGADLAEMVRIGLPVPPGFTITTEACRRYLRYGEPPARLAGEIGTQLQRLEQQLGRELGIPPTRCSCRSARAPRSRCPG